MLLLQEILRRETDALRFPRSSTYCFQYASFDLAVPFKKCQRDVLFHDKREKLLDVIFRKLWTSLHAYLLIEPWLLPFRGSQKLMAI